MLVLFIEKTLTNKFINKGFIYKGLNRECMIIINSCPIYFQKKRQFIKREPSQRITFRRPFERFITDLMGPPYEIIVNINIRYQFNIINHFSK